MPEDRRNARSRNVLGVIGQNSHGLCLGSQHHSRRREFKRAYLTAAGVALGLVGVWALLLLFA
jgi:hypothetical protein